MRDRGVTEPIDVWLPPDDDSASRVGTVAARLGVELVVGPAGPNGARVGDVTLAPGSANWLIEAAILRALEPSHILFLCVANSARSQMGEGIARRLAPEGVTISSAGSAPTSVRPEAIAVLAEVDIDISGHRSRGIDEVEGPVDAVITLCAEEVCPTWLEDAWRLHWGLPDPAGVAGTEQERLDAFRGVRDELTKRLRVVFGGGVDA